MMLIAGVVLIIGGFKTLPLEFDISVKGLSVWWVGASSIVFTTVPAAAVIHYHLQIKENHVHKEKMKNASGSFISLMTLGILGPLIIAGTSFMSMLQARAKRNRKDMHNPGSTKVKLFQNQSFDEEGNLKVDPLILRPWGRVMMMVLGIIQVILSIKALVEFGDYVS